MQSVDSPSLQCCINLNRKGMLLADNKIYEEKKKTREKHRGAASYSSPAWKLVWPALRQSGKDLKVFFFFPLSLSVLSIYAHQLDQGVLLPDRGWLGSFFRTPREWWWSLRSKPFLMYHPIGSLYKLPSSHLSSSFAGDTTLFFLYTERIEEEERKNRL